MDDSFFQSQRIFEWQLSLVSPESSQGGGFVCYLVNSNATVANVLCPASEEYRVSGPLLTKPLWSEALQRAGFDGLRVSLSDDEKEEQHGLSLMVSLLPSPTAHNGNRSVFIITETTEQNDLAKAIRGCLDPQSPDLCNIIPISSLASVTSTCELCISLLEVGNTIMDRMTEVQFAALQQISKISRQILWINQSCGERPERPEGSMASGFGKTLMRELPHLSFIHLNVQARDFTGESPICARILRVIEQTQIVHPKEQETDLLEQGNAIYIPRVIESPHMNKLLHSELHGLRPEAVKVDRTWNSNENPLELRFIPGLLDSFHFSPDLAASRILQQDEVEVSVEATGINFKDVMVALNQVIDDHIGQEFAGVITKIGPNTKSAFCEGDRVCGIVDGSFRTLVHAKCSHVMRIPDSIPSTEACSIPVSYATAQYGLCHLARLKAGETILIHAAAGAVGQAAIQIAQRACAIVYVTVSTPAKKKLLIDRYGLDPSHFFSSRSTIFAQQIMHITAGKGIDVAFNSLSGQALTETWRCLAAFGRFVEIGKRDITTFKSLPMEPFQRNVSFCSLDLAVLSKSDNGLMKEVMSEVQELVLDMGSRQYTAPFPLTIFKRSEFEKAFRFLQTGQHMGKAVVDWRQEDTIQVYSDEETIAQHALTGL